VRTLFWNEVVKTYSKWRSSIAFIAILIVVPLVLVAMKLQGAAMVKTMARGIAPDVLPLERFLNGYFVTAVVMNALWIHIPFLLTLGAGDQLAGEAAAGTFRLMLVRPVSRTRVLMAKFLTTLFYTFTVVLFLVALSVLLGILLFGTGPLLMPGKTLAILPTEAVPLRLVFACLLATWGMWAVASLTFFFSSLADNALGPILGTMAVLIIFYVIGAIPLDLFRNLRPLLFTSYLDIWQKALEDSIAWGELLRSGAVLGASSIGFYLMAWYIFIRKDILT
jgi:ABC-2 type transport system permease protein